MSAFSEWSEPKRKEQEINACRTKFMNTGECEHCEVVRKKLELLVNRLVDHLKQETIPPLDVGPNRVHVMPVRIIDECGWAVEMFGSFRDQAELVTKRFDQKITEVIHEYRDQFEAAFDEARSKNYYVELADEPRVTRFGFLVLSGEGIVHHVIKRSDYLNPTRGEFMRMGFAL